MKKPILFFMFCFLVIVPVSYTQKANEVDFIKESGISTISFETNAYYEDVKFPFKQIKVIDYRYDTTKIGYRGKGKLWNQVKPAGNWTDILNSYFKKNLDASANRILIVCIKSFWIQPGVIEQITKKKVIQKDVMSRSSDGGVCSADLEIYSQSGIELQAMFRINETFLFPDNYNKKSIKDLFFLPFDSLARKIKDEQQIQQILSRRKKISFAEVSGYYEKRFNIPVLVDGNIRKGIFLKFEDFKENKPLEKGFKMKTGKLSDELYVKNDGSEDLIEDYWGFYDGQHVFMKIGYSIFQMVRKQNTFELFGAKYISNYHNNPGRGSIKINMMGMDKKILQLDMDKGEVY